MFQLSSPRKTCEKTFVSLFSKETDEKNSSANNKQQQSEFHLEKAQPLQQEQRNPQLLCVLVFSQQQLNQSELCSTLNPSVINQGTSAELSLGFKRMGEDKLSLKQCGCPAALVTSFTSRRDYSSCVLGIFNLEHREN